MLTPSPRPQSAELELKRYRAEIEALKTEQQRLIAERLDETAAAGRAGQLGLPGPSAPRADTDPGEKGIVKSFMLLELQGYADRLEKQLEKANRQRDKYLAAAHAYRARLQLVKQGKPDPGAALSQQDRGGWRALGEGIAGQTGPRGGAEPAGQRWVAGAGGGRALTESVVDSSWGRGIIPARLS